MNTKEKTLAINKLSLNLRKLIEANKVTSKSNAINSLRKLAASSGVEYSIIQKIAASNKDPQYTTLIAISEGLNMSIDEFLSGINKITDQELKEYQTSIQKSRKERMKKK